jgi:hypothetical protein
MTYTPPPGDEVSFDLVNPSMAVAGNSDFTAFQNTVATFIVTVTNGATPYTYQWYENGVAMSGETAATLDFTAAIEKQGNEYYCVVTGADSFQVTSRTSTLTITPLNLTILTQPVDTAVLFGADITLTVVAQSSGGIATYQWYDASDDSPVPGATFPAFPVTTSATVDMTGDAYYVIVTDDNSSVQSDTATLTVTYNIEAIRELRITPWSVANAYDVPKLLKSQLIQWSVYDAFNALRVENFRCPVRAHRGITKEGVTYWIPFYDKSAKCHRGPLVNDAYNRYYWTQDSTEPRYAPLQMLQLDGYTEGLTLGVPAPTSRAQVITDAGGEDDTIVDRAYVYTYVTLYGEEGPPSPPTLVSGVEGNTWFVTNMAKGPQDGKNRRISHKNIYRTISTGGSAEYHFVRKVPIETTIYADTLLTSEVALNFTLESTSWNPPEPEMTGMIAHPNGFFVGFHDRTLMFSEPYRPHAWPVEYQLSTVGKIVALGIFGTSVVVATDSHPYLATGISPAGMVLTMHDTAEPCLSRYGLVSMPYGVMYPTPNGLALASPNGIEVATKNLMTKQEWQTRYRVAALDACQYEDRYIGFFSETRGFMFSPMDDARLIDLNLLDSESTVQRQDSVFTDVHTGKVFMMSNCELYEWNPLTGIPLEYDWESLEFDGPEPVNFGAARLIWYAPYTPPSAEQTAAWRAWNAARMAAAPLNPMNYSTLNTVRQETVPEFDDFVQNKQPFHWSPLIKVPPEGEQWPNTPFVILDVIANDKVVYSKNITHTKMFRLPAGYKATMYRFRLRSNIHIQSLKVAETGQELARI